MKLESSGILIDLRPLNERDSLAYIFTCDNGVLTGMMRGGACARKNRPLVGQVGALVWNARVDSQLGVFHWDATHNLAAGLMMSPVRLSLMNSVFGLIRTLLPEREEYNSLYVTTYDLLLKLAASNNPLDDYLVWEVALLRELGYAIDIGACAGCGGHENLNFMSPRTCRAVCDNCAAPYIDRLYRLPVTLKLTRQLIEQVCVSQGVKLPGARQILRME